MATRDQYDIKRKIFNIDETGVDRYDSKKVRMMAPPHRAGALAVNKDILKGKRSPLELQNVQERTEGSSVVPDACSINGWITNEI
jgi:hypothetical protein